MQPLRLATLLKRDCNTGIFLWILRNFQEYLLWKTSANGCFCALKSPEIFKTYSGWCLPKIYLNRQKKFNVSNKVSSIASTDAFIIATGDIFMHFFWRVKSLLEYLFVTLKIFTINRTENCSTTKELRRILPWKFKRLSRIIFHNLQSGCFSQEATGVIL